MEKGQAAGRSSSQSETNKLVLLDSTIEYSIIDISIVMTYDNAEPNKIIVKEVFTYHHDVPSMIRNRMSKIGK